jgi:hypothetical protein
MAQRRIGKVELTSRCAKAPTKHPAVNIIRNITLRFLSRFFKLPKHGSTTTSMNAAVAIAVVISVIFNDRLIATCPPDEYAKQAITAIAAGPSRRMGKQYWIATAVKTRPV